MPEVTHPSLIEEGSFRTHRLAVAERAYCAKYIGKGKLWVSEEPPGEGANPLACFDTLEIMSYYPHLHDRAAERFISSIAYENKKERMHQETGRVDLQAIGVGPGVGQSHEERLFDFELYAVTSLGVGADWAAEFREDGHAVVVQDPTLVADSRRLDCQWCAESNSGKGALKAMSKHVKKSHPEHRQEWAALRREIQADPLYGVEAGVLVAEAGEITEAPLEGAPADG